MPVKPGFLTIRGGRFRGKKLPIPADNSVRPTTDRARETVFNLIEQHFRHKDGRLRWTGARVLDAFAGTGALGLESASRGAAHVSFWDSNPDQVAGLKKSTKMFSGFTSTVAGQNALKAPIQDRAVDLVFLDPPYGKDLVAQSVSVLRLQGWINDQTLIYAESEDGCPVPEGLTMLVERKAANSLLRLLQVDQTVLKM